MKPATLRMRKWRKENPKRDRDNRIRQRLNNPPQYDPVKGPGYSRKCRYGVTPERYDQMAAEQDHKCAICGKQETVRKDGIVVAFSIDHDHDTNAIRQLLCRRCNSGLGLFNDSLELIVKAAEYLKRHRKEPTDVAS